MIDCLLESVDETISACCPPFEPSTFTRGYFAKWVGPRCAMRWSTVGDEAYGSSVRVYPPSLFAMGGDLHRHEPRDCRRARSSQQSQPGTAGHLFAAAGREGRPKARAQDR